MPNFRVANLLRDRDVLELARKQARCVLEGPNEQISQQEMTNAVHAFAESLESAVWPGGGGVTGDWLLVTGRGPVVSQQGIKSAERIMNHAQEILQSLTERFSASANVKQVFGEPIEAHGKTIVPVARVMYHVGAGWGGRKAETEDGGMGGGGGGGVVVAVPAGVLEVTPEGVRFERFFGAKRAGMLVGLGFVMGLAARRLLSSK